MTRHDAVTNLRPYVGRDSAAAADVLRDAMDGNTSVNASSKSGSEEGRDLSQAVSQ
ncbi:MAG: hypothetical protein R3B90_10140 [Planctomycetaceae bacterium]